MKEKQIEEAVAKVIDKVKPVPAEIKGTRWGFRGVNHAAKTITVMVNTPRECRHPEEYGARGRKAAAKADKWENDSFGKLWDIAKDAGYRLEMHG